MPKTEISTSAAPAAAGPYSQGIRAGDYVFVAGQGPGDPARGPMAFVSDEIEGQTAQTIDNLEAILQAAGASLADVVKVTVHLSDLANFAAFNGVYAERFPDPKPVRTTVGSQLPPGMLVEIDVTAYVG